MMKELKVTLWVNPTGNERGQHARPCKIVYDHAPALSGKLYKLVSAVDFYKEDTIYEVDGDRGVDALNPDLDTLITLAIPQMVEFAKNELGIDLHGKKPRKPGGPAKKTMPRIRDDEENQTPMFKDMPE